MEDYKGVGIVFLRKFVQAHGEAIERKLISGLTPLQLQTYQHAQNRHWISTGTAAEIFHIVAQLLYPGDDLGLQHLGRERAKYNFSGIYRTLLKVATIPFLVRQAAKMWRISYNQGVAKAERIENKNEVHFFVENYPGLPPVLREVGCGYIRGVVEFAGKKNIQVRKEDLNPKLWKWIITWDEVSA
jgi:hypothetical protein